MNNSSAAPKPILIGCTHASAESCLLFSWGQDMHHSVEPTSLPSSSSLPQVCSGGDSTGLESGGAGVLPKALLQLSAALLP